MISDFYGVKSSTNDVDKVIELIDELPEVSNIDPIKTFATLDTIGLIYDDLSESALSQVTNKTKYEQVKAAYDSQYRVLLNPRLYQDMAVEGGANATYTKSFITDKTYGPVLKIDASVNSGTSQLYSYNLPNVTFAATDVLNFAIYLNDKYAYDAPSTNGYVGILWAIGALHDRAFTDYPITGKIRRMTYDSIKSKYNIQKYIDKYMF